MAAQLFYLPFAVAAKPTGVGAPGAKAYFYAPGTTTLRTVYSNAGLSTPRSNPVIADGAGQFPAIYINDTLTYKLVITDRNGSVLYTRDPYIPGEAPDASVLSPYSDAAASSATAASTSATAAATSATAAATSATAAATSATASAASASSAATQAAAAAASAAEAEDAVEWALNIEDVSNAILADIEAARVTVHATLSTSEFTLEQLAASGLPINVKWFGAVGDGVTDDSDAFIAAIALARSMGIANQGYAHRAAPTVRVPLGVYYMGSTTLDFRCGLIFEGETGAGPAGGSSTLRWDDGVPGLRFQFANTTGAEGTQTTDLTATASGSIVRNLRLEGARSDALDDGVSFGIHMRAPITVRDVMLVNWGSNGVQIRASFGGGGIPDGNGNVFHLDRVWTESCYHGVNCEGADSNAGVGININGTSNYGWGIRDSSFLGNTWLGGHQATNVLGPFTCVGANARSVFIGIYTEPDQPEADVRSPSMVIGGHQGAGVEANGSTATRPWLSSQYDGLQVAGDLSVDRYLNALYVRSYGTIGYGQGAAVGGTVTQATSKSTAVTLNKSVGKITMHNAALAANTSVSFTLNNSQIFSLDLVVAKIVTGATANSYTVDVDDVGVGSCRIHVRNVSGGSLGEAIEIRFMVFKGSND